ETQDVGPRAIGGGMLPQPRDRDAPSMIHRDRPQARCAAAGDIVLPYSGNATEHAAPPRTGYSSRMSNSPTSSRPQASERSWYICRDSTPFAIVLKMDRTTTSSDA